MSAPRARPTRHRACEFDHPENQHLRIVPDSAANKLSRQKLRGVETNHHVRPPFELMRHAYHIGSARCGTPTSSTYMCFGALAHEPDGALEDEHPRFLATEFPILKRIKPKHRTVAPRGERRFLYVSLDLLIGIYGRVMQHKRR